MRWFRRKKDSVPPEKTDAPPPPEPPADGLPPEPTAVPPEPEPEPEPPVVSPEPEPEPETVAAFPEPEAPAASPEPERRGRYFSRLRQRLAKTRQGFAEGFGRILTGRKKIDAATLEQIEELLITSDVGVQTATELIERITAAKVEDADALQELLRTEILAVLSNRVPPMRPAARPHVVMVVGVNGVGKTTTIGKLAARLAAEGRSVLIAAGDTFRAAAADQLAIWAERAGAGIIRHKDGTDPAAVAFDAVEAALARQTEVVIVDTAGRLHTKVNLMEEIKKVKRSIAKRLPEAPHEVLLVLDATTGQNAISQAQLFHEALGVTGIALTKLDGTAKGGIVIAIARAFDIPLQYIGIGESIEDLQDFDPEQFVKALFSAG
jgi:fused signal recognition particle receptor